MRALLVVNPTATATTSKVRDVIARALASELKVDVVETRHRGHAAALATEAARDDVDVVVALGGDGTVNEVVNGLLVDGTGPDVPALAVVPGGSTNVFSRALGASSNPIEATAEILVALREGRSRRVSLGRADERWFTFTAGLGYDADVVRAVERKRAAGHPSTPGLYIRTALRRFLLRPHRRRPAISVAAPGQEPVDDLFFCVASNVNPWTYVGTRAVTLSPQASFDRGLELFALHRLTTVEMLRHAVQALRRDADLTGRGVVTRHDVAELWITASRPQAFQVDGDYVGERNAVRLRSCPAALSVVV